MSYHQRFFENSGRLLQLPFEGLAGNQQPQSHRRGFSDDLRELPHNRELAERQLRSWKDVVPAEWGARDRSVRAMPHQQQLQHPADSMLRMSPGGFPGH